MKNTAPFEASRRVLASVQVVLTDELCQIVRFLSDRAYCRPLTAIGDFIVAAQDQYGFLNVGLGPATQH